MLHLFDHRWATYDQADIRVVSYADKGNPNSLVLPHYWIPEEELDKELSNKWAQDWSF